MSASAISCLKCKLSLSRSCKIASTCTASSLEPLLFLSSTRRSTSPRRSSDFSDRRRQRFAYFCSVALFTSVVQLDGSPRWFTSMVHLGGSSHWFASVVHLGGSPQWFASVSSPRWVALVVHLGGSSLWFTSVVHLGGSPVWFASVVHRWFI